MNTIEINVKNQDGSILGKLDLGEAEINIVYQIADIREPDKKQADYTIPFSIPGTKKNNQLFQQIFENGFSSFTYNPNKKIDAQIIVNGNQYFSGDLQLNSINKEDNKIIGYEITIYGRIPSFFDAISDYDLKDIIDLSDYNHNYSRTNVTKSWDTYIIQYNQQKTFNLGDGYVYPMEWRGQNNPLYWKVEDFKPSIYAKTIFDRIMKSQGYTYNSKFLNSQLFKKLIIPYNGDDTIALTDDQIKQLEVWAKFPAPPNRPILSTQGSKTGQDYNNIPIIFSDDVNSPAADFGNHYNPSTGVITIPKNGKWTLSTTVRLTAEFNGTEIGGDNNLYSSLKIFGGPIEGVLKIVDYDSGSTLSSTAFTFNCPQIDGDAHSTPIVSEIQEPNVSYTGYLSAGKRYRVILDWRTTGSNYTYKTKAQGFGGAWYQKNTQIDIRVQTVPIGQSYNPYGAPRFLLTLVDKSVSEDDVLDMNWFIPDMKADEFVSEITRLFNLYWIRSGDKYFTIEPRNDFYNSGTIVDWTDKVNNDEDVKIQPLYDLSAKKYNFSYAEDGDYYNSDYTMLYDDEVYGSKRLVVDNDFVSDVLDISSSFAATPMVQYLGTDRVLPTYVSMDGNTMKSYKPKLRILFYGGLIPTTSQWNFKNPYTNIVIAPNLVKYPYAGHFDNPINPTYDLNWGMCKKYYYNWTNISNGNLFNTYWRDYIEEIVDKNNHLLTAIVILNDYDMINFDLRNLVQVDNVYYRVNKLTHNPLNGETEIELFRAKDYKPRAISIVNPTSGGNGGVGDGTFPKDLYVAWSFKEQFAESVSSMKGYEIPIDWRIPYIRTELSKISEKSVFIPIEAITPIKVETDGYSSQSSMLYTKSGQSWGDKKPIASWYPTQNRDVNGNFYSPQAAQKVIGENNYIDPSAFAVEIKGSNNVIMDGVKNAVITGENNIISSGLNNITVVGDNQRIYESNTSYINGVAIKNGEAQKKISILRSPSNSSGVDVCRVNGGKNSVKADKKYIG